MTRFLLGCLFMALSFEAGEHDWQPFKSAYCLMFHSYHGERCK